ncbi:MAG: hypothetical protein J1E61_07235 [Lachnospiraceae bacterium]|nr:hypothetical protein [Lachnospiraceae bacterium]
MKKAHFFRSLMLIWLVGTVVLSGCGSREEELLTDSHSLGIGNKLRLNESRPYSISMKIFDPVGQKQWELEGELKYSVNILEDVESATVTDGSYSITLGMDFADVAYEEELPQSGEWITPIWYNTWPIYHTYHDYEDIRIYTGEYNPINGDYTGFHDYVLEVIFFTPRFSNSDGIKVGMTEEDLIGVYGEDLERGLIIYGDGSYYCYFDDGEYTHMEFHINFQGKIEEMSVEIMGAWWDVYT